MKLVQIVSTVLIASALLITIPGCEKGPAQKAGKSIDNAVDSTGDSIENAGDSIKDTVQGNN
jgi:hypothetical protein